VKSHKENLYFFVFYCFALDTQEIACFVLTNMKGWSKVVTERGLFFYLPGQRGCIQKKQDYKYIKQRVACKESLQNIHTTKPWFFAK